MKKLAFALTMIWTLSTFAQTESPIHREVAANFEKQYNAGDFNAVFAAFSPQMQAALPLDKTVLFLDGLQKQAGKITARNFSRNDQSYAVYKTHFERAVFALNIAVDENAKIMGLSIRPFVEDAKAKMERTKTKMILPFEGEWFVFWGGDTKEENYHVESKAQKNAFDFIIMDKNGKSHKNDGQSNDDYYAFGKPINSAAEGEVVLVVDGIKDNKPGVMNPMYVPGNTVVVKTANNEYLYFCHFKQSSIVVKQGQKVARGQLLGLCGNSGNSSEAHLHFHIQDAEDMNAAIGVKCHFENVTVNGQARSDYSPVKNDKIRS